MKRLIFLCLSISLCFCPAYADEVDVKWVEGTPLSEFSNAFEILRRFSSLTVSDNAFSIAGKGPAVIFVDGRRIGHHIDLSMIPAASVEKVEIISEPRPEYDNKDAVILVTTIKAKNNEFHLTDVANLTVSPLAGGANDVEVSGRMDKLSYEGGLAVSYFPTRCKEIKTTDTYTENPDKSGIWIGERKVQDYYDIKKNMSVAAKASIGWHISPEHQMRVRYEYNYQKSSGDLGDLEYVKYCRKGSVLDLVNPSERYSVSSVTNTGTHTHKLSLSYEGNVSGWKFAANVDMFGGHKNGKDVKREFPEGTEKCTLDKDYRYLVEQSFARFNASHPLWKGDILCGLSLENYYQNTRTEDFCIKDSRLHNDLNDLLPGAYVTLKQDFGFLNMDVGLHYQAVIVDYNPREDDCTRGKIIEMLGRPDIFYSEWLLHPHITLSSPVGGEGKISAGAQVNTDFPQYSALSIRIKDLKKDDISMAFTYPGRRDEFFLQGRWKWILARGWATHNVEPIFKDIGGEGDFNGPDFWSMDWRLSLSPSIGIWATDLTATLHKQWLKMETLDSEDNLSTPTVSVNWINSMSFPWGMRADLATRMHTRGAENNCYYRNVFFKADLSVQQPFLDNRLVVTAGIENLARTSEKMSFHTRTSDMEFNWNDHLDYRIFRLSLKFNL